MSSFICSPKHFNSIENAFISFSYSNDFYYPYSLKTIYPVLYNRRENLNEDIEKEITGIIDNLRTLNALCVCLQYKHHYEGVLDNEIKEETEQLLQNKRESKPLNKIELYKALSCVGYQIETCHLKELRSLTPAEENALFFLDEMQKYLAADIVSHLPGYDSAAWEIG